MSRATGEHAWTARTNNGIPVRPEDFPRGLTETGGAFTRLLMDLKDGTVMDAGLVDYGEFFVSLNTGWELLHRAEVLFDGEPGRVQVVHRFLNGVQMKWSPLDGGPPGLPEPVPVGEHAGGGVRIAVLGAGGPAGSNWLRALSLAGHDLVAVDATESHLVWCELYADTCVHAPWLTADLVNGLGCDVVFAMPDNLVRWLAEHRDELAAAVFLPSLDVIERCQDKAAAVEAWAADELRSGPVSIVEPLPDHLHLAKDRFGLPFWLRATHGAGAKGATLVEDLRTGFHWLRYWQTRGTDTDWIAEEFFPGRDYAWTGVYLHGELVTSFARERLEYIYPNLSPSGLTGTPTVARVVHDEIVNAVAEQAVRVIDANPTGIYAVDLREDTEGVPRPTEVNPGRGGTTTGLWATCGVNFAHLAARLADGDWSQLGRWPVRDALPEGLELRRHIDCEAVFVNERVVA